MPQAALHCLNGTLLAVALATASVIALILGADDEAHFLLVDVHGVVRRLARPLPAAHAHGRVAI